MEKDAVLNLRVTIPYTDALMYSTESFKYKQSCILNKVIQTSHKEEIIQKNLQKQKKIGNMKILAFHAVPWVPEAFNAWFLVSVKS